MVRYRHLVDNVCTSCSALRWHSMVQSGDLTRFTSFSHVLLPQIFQIVAHLVYWGKAIIIYPLCENNVYMLSPHANICLWVVLMGCELSPTLSLASSVSAGLITSICAMNKLYWVVGSNSNFLLLTLDLSSIRTLYIHLKQLWKWKKLCIVE